MSATGTEFKSVGDTFRQKRGAAVAAPRPGAGNAPMREREQLLLRLHPAPGQRLAKECMVPPGANSLAFAYLGDMQLRFVFDQPGVAVPSAVRTEDFARLDLSPGRAMVQALANIKRLGAPQIASLGAGVYSLRGAQPEYGPVHMLDRTFWRGQLEKFPRGLLAALPRKGVLMFAPAGDPAVEGELLRQAARMLAAADTAAISSLVYRFDATGWTQHGELPRPQTAAAPAAAGATRDDDGGDEDAVEEGVDLDKAAQGQKMLIRSIVAGFVVNAMFRAQVHPAVLLAAVLAVSCYSLVGVVRISSGLAKSSGITILLMVLSFFPLLGLVSWIVLSWQTTRALRQAGWQVGLLGARA